MGKSLSIITTFLFLQLFFSCTGSSSISEDISSAEDLIQVHPDSALLILDGLKNRESMNKKLAMHYELTRALALIAADKKFPDEFKFDNVLGYYSNHGTNKERSRANFVMGCLLSKQEDAPLALQYFNEAVSAADSSKVNSDHWLLNKAYDHLTDLATLNHLYENALDWSQKSIEAAYNNLDTIRIIEGLKKKALIFHKLSKPAYAVRELEQARELYRQLGRDVKAAQLALTCANYSLPCKDVTNVLAYLEEYEKYSGLIDSEGEPTAKHEEYFWTKGRYYYCIFDYKNAEKYLRRLYNTIDSTEETIDAGKILFNIYVRNHNYYEAANILSSFSYNERTSESKAVRDEIIKYNALYNYTVQKIQKEKSEKYALTYKYWLAFSGIITILVLFILYVIISKYIANRRRAAEELERRDIRNAELKTRLTRALEELKVSEANLEDFKKIKLQEITEIQKDYYLSLVDKLRHRAARGEFAAESDINDLVEYIKTTNSKLFRLVAGNGNLSVPEQHLCYLIALKFASSEASALMGLSPQRITNMKRMVNERLFNEGSAKTLEKNIGNL